MKKEKEFASKGRDQLLRYFEERSVGDDNNVFFETRKNKLSVLYDAYKKIACVPSSSAAVERSFSIQGIIQSAIRSSLKAITVRRLLIIRANLAFMKNTPYYNHFTRYLKISDGLSSTSRNSYFRSPQTN